MKKAPNPREYFASLAQQLKKDYYTIYKELLAFRFQRWDSGNINYQKKLGERLAEKLGNPHGYAGSTLVANIRSAALTIERRERTEKAK